MTIEVTLAANGDASAVAKWTVNELLRDLKGLFDPEGRLRYLALGGREWHSGPYMNFLRGLSGH